MQPFRTEQGWIEYFKERSAFWKHNGNPKRPHALLTSGGHSTGFFDWQTIAQDPGDAVQTVHDLELLVENQWGLGGIDDTERVIGPGYGAITLADRLAERIGIRSGLACKSGFTQKGPDDSMILRVRLNPGEHVLHVEDTLTSGASINKAIAATEQAGGLAANIIVAVCNRSGLTEINGRKIISLITVPMQNWSANECPLCAQGSEAIPPKKPAENWLRLNAEYEGDEHYG